MSSDPDEPVEPRSILGLPVRLVLALGGVALPLLAIAWFTSTHAWPAPTSCEFAPFGCPPFDNPLNVQPLDWLDLAGPALGIAFAVGAMRLSKDPAERGMLIYRYVLPVLGVMVSVACALVLVWLIAF
jgi:hypothetical protein